MSFPSLKFSENSSVAQLVGASERGVLFFHAHNHQGSYQLLTRSMKELHESGVRHFYLEVPKFLNEVFEAHRKGNLKPFEACLLNFQDELVRREIKALVEAAHRTGISIIAVDANENLNTGTKIGGSEQAKKLIAKRLNNDEKMASVIQHFAGTLKPLEKFSGLFGGNHVAICHQKPGIPSVSIIEHNQLPPSATHMNYLSEAIQGSNEKTNQHLKQFNVIMLVPSKLDQDEIDFTEETVPSSLKFLNQLLESYQLTGCKAYKHTKSEQIDAVMEFSLNEKESAIKAWEKICIEMDPLPKFMAFESDAIRIIFKSLETTAVLRQLVAAVIELKKKKR